jgi:SPP1 gp7 family putative phage head morphogenesis protein
MVEQMEEYEHKLRRRITTSGTKVNMLATQVAAFGSNADSVLQLISATTGIPQRILTGSERGELASVQDRNNWNDRVAERRREYAEPLIKRLLQRLIEKGALPQPKRLEIVWPEIDEIDEDQKASVALKYAQANQANTAAGGRVIVTEDEVRQNVLGLDPLEDVETQGSEQAVERAAARLADTEPDEPEWRAVHDAADAHRAALARAFVGAWRDAAAAIDEEQLVRAIEAGALHTAEAAALRAVNQAEAELAEMLPDRLLAVLVDGGMASARSARSRGSFFRGASTAQPRALFEASFDQANERAVGWAAGRSATLIVEIGPDTRAAVRELIASGIVDGVAPRKLVRRLREVVGLRSDQVRALSSFAERLRAAGASESAIARQSTRYAEKLRRDRALLIARTETLRASNEGQRELWRQAQERGELPQDLQRVWISTPDSRTRPEHADRDGVVVGLYESWPWGTEPGEEPNCRCAQGVATAEDVVAAGGRSRVAA